MNQNAYKYILTFNCNVKNAKKNLDTSPYEVRKFENGKIELTNLGSQKMK